MTDSAQSVQPAGAKPKSPPGWLATTLLALVLTAVVMGIAGYGYYLDALDRPNNYLWYAVAAYAVELIVFSRGLALFGVFLVPILGMFLYMPSESASTGVLAMRGVEQHAIVGKTVSHHLDHCLRQMAVGGGGNYGGVAANPLYGLDGHRLYGAVPGHTPTHDYREGEHVVILADPQHEVCAQAKREVDHKQYVVLPAITTAVTFLACFIIASVRRSCLRGEYEEKFRKRQGTDALENYERSQGDEVLAANLAGRMHCSQFWYLPVMVFFGLGVLGVTVGAITEAWAAAHDSTIGFWSAAFPAIVAVPAGLVGFWLTVPPALELAFRRVKRVEGRTVKLANDPDLVHGIGMKIKALVGYPISIDGKVFVATHDPKLRPDGDDCVAFVTTVRKRAVNVVPTKELPPAVTRSSF